jgi:hypothetical protein
MTRDHSPCSRPADRLAPWFALSLVAMLAACDAPPGTAPVSASGAIVVLDDCDDWGCGKNSPVVGGLSFHEIHPRGLPNSAGLTVGAFRTASGLPLTLNIDGHRLYGLTSTGWRLEGDRLVNATLELFRNGEGFALLRITQAGTTSFWVDPTDPVPVYTFVYQQPGQDPRELCPGLGLSQDEASKFGGAHTAILFAGDRYDAVTKTLVATGHAAGNWINLACAGTATAKMHLLRHTQAGSDTSHQTDVAQRTAMFKMISADYCGTGQAFTVSGEPLVILDSRGWFAPPMDGVDSIESIWTAQGAACLGQARRAAEDPTISDKIAQACPSLPSCEGLLLPDWTSAGYLLSGNPH